MYRETVYTIPGIELTDAREPFLVPKKMALLALWVPLWDGLPMVPE